MGDKVAKQAGKKEINVLIDFATEFGTGIYDINRFLEEQQKRSKFQALCKIANYLTTSLDLKEILSMILNSCVNDLKFDRAKLYLRDDKKELLYGFMSVDMRGVAKKIK